MGNVSLPGICSDGKYRSQYPLGSATAPLPSIASGSYAPGTQFSLSSPTPNATIYYTTDGTTPTTSSAIASAPIAITQSVTVTSIAVAPGYFPSILTTTTYTVSSGQTATPVLSLASGTYNGTQNITITDSTGGAVIYYTTNGTTPTTASPVYSSAIPISVNTTLQAIAVAAGLSASAVASATYVINSASQVSPPVFSLPNGTYTTAQTTTISCPTTGSSIYYTTDGTTPTYPVTGTTTLYTGALTISASEKISAIGVAAGSGNSSVATAIYTINSGTQALAVIFSPAPGSYAGTRPVTMAAGTFGSGIYYTTDGTTPTYPMTGTTQQYSPASPVSISATMTLNALAAATGLANSGVSTGTFTIFSAQVAAPTFSPVAGAYSVFQTVTITVPTGATCYYTTDGSQPTLSSSVYSAPITVSATGVIKAFATKTGLAPSVIAGAGYTINGVVYNKRLPYSSAGIKVVGNTFSNGTQQGILMGANLSGLEYIPVQEAFTGAGETGDWAGIQPNYPYLSTWNFNCVRIPLNAASWLGLTCTAINSAGTGWATTANADHNGTYRASVLSAVASANAIGCYVILDLHWSAPYLTIGGVTNLTAPLGQAPFANTDTDTAFWASIAQTFSGNPTVMFELFNEPYSSGYTSETNARSLALYGGAFSRWTQTGYSYNAQNTGNWYQLGFQSMVNTIRLYATNVILYSGQEFSQSMKYRIQDLPYDPLGNIAAIAHPYPNTYNGNNNYPYTAYGPYGTVGADTGYAAPSATDILEAVNVIYGGIPVMNTEDGGTAGTAATATPYSEPHIAYMAYNFCDTYGASFIAWQFNLYTSYNTTNTSNFLNRTTSASNSAGTPVTGQGTTFYNWTTGHA